MKRRTLFKTIAGAIAASFAAKAAKPEPIPPMLVLDTVTGEVKPWQREVIRAVSRDEHLEESARRCEHHAKWHENPANWVTGNLTGEQHLERAANFRQTAKAYRDEITT